VQDERGASDFEAIQSAMRSRPQRLMLYAFDLLALDGEDIRNHSLEERRLRLRSLIARSAPAIPFGYRHSRGQDPAHRLLSCFWLGSPPGRHEDLPIAVVVCL
jgi:ATP-dependent DNA ligase